jgi:hypothetical protein
MKINSNGHLLFVAERGHVAELSFYGRKGAREI